MSEIKTILNGENKIIAIETDKNIYYLKEPKRLNDGEDVVQLISAFENIIDIDLIKTEKKKESGEWIIDDVKEFINLKYDLSREYFFILAEKGDWTDVDELLRELKERVGNNDLVPQAIAGIRSGNTRMYKKMGKENLDEQYWDDKDWVNKYRIKPKYLRLVKQVINEYKRD